MTLNVILASTSKTDRLGRCVLRLPQCSDDNACPLHESWKDLRSGVAAMLEKNTLADLAAAAGK